MAPDSCGLSGSFACKVIASRTLDRCDIKLPRGTPRVGAGYPQRKAAHVLLLLERLVDLPRHRGELVLAYCE